MAKQVWAKGVWAAGTHSPNRSVADGNPHARPQPLPPPPLLPVLPACLQPPDITGLYTHLDAGDVSDGGSALARQVGQEGLRAMARAGQPAGGGWDGTMLNGNFVVLDLEWWHSKQVRARARVFVSVRFCVQASCYGQAWPGVARGDVSAPYLICACAACLVLGTGWVCAHTNAACNKSHCNLCASNAGGHAGRCHMALKTARTVHACLHSCSEHGAAFQLPAWGVHI